MGVEMSSVGAPRGKHAASHSIAHQPRRHEVTFLLGLVAFAILTVTWTSLLPSTALPGVRRGISTRRASRRQRQRCHAYNPRGRFPRPRKRS